MSCTPAFKCPTVNIGPRHDGRLRGLNVVDADYRSSDIVAATKRCLFDEDFREICRKSPNPYWLGDAGKKIAKVLADTELNDDLLRKKMTLKGEVKNGWYQ